MSTELEKQAEASLSVLAGLECGFDGGPVGPDGHCSEAWHAHCPFCGENWDCEHEVARWDDSFGYVGPEFPPPPESNDAICDQPAHRVRELLSDLAPVWDVYRQHLDESAKSAGTDVLEALIETLDLKVVAVEWEQTESRASGVGASVFALDADALLAELICASARIQAMFDGFQTHGTLDGDHAERALVVLARPTCQETGFPIDLAAGYCGDGQRDDRTHTHCPFCGSADECPHLLGQWGDDFGYSGPDMPLVPEEWDVPGDWTDGQLREVLGDLLSAFLAYPDYGNEFGPFGELTELVDSAVHRVSWCGDGMAAGVGVVCYAVDVPGTTTQLRVLADRLEAAISKLDALRPVGSDEEDL